MFCPINSKFKDYISQPKTNKYMSLHTTIFGPDDKIIQIQIKTKEMDNINTYGIASLWSKYRELGSKKMQEELSSNYQFMNTLNNLNDNIDNDKLFLERIQNEIFSKNIYVYTTNGDIIELPNNATPLDFAYKVHKDIGNHFYKCYINGVKVNINHKLKNKDRINILVNDESKPKYSWLNFATTTLAKKCIKEFLNNKNK